MSDLPHPPGNNRDRENLWLALSLVSQLGFLIAVPALVFGFGGAYLDKWWGTGPFLLIACLALSFLLSSLLVYRKVREIIRP